jgi:hypothetical protein
MHEVSREQACRLKVVEINNSLSKEASCADLISLNIYAAVLARRRRGGKVFFGLFR